MAVFQVNKHLETSVPGVFAVGDVNGGLQFTYISLDDFRIVFNYLTGDGSYNLETRGAVPTAMFLNPPLAQVGLTEDHYGGRWTSCCQGTSSCWHASWSC